ncbi:MAG TPA: hypothetical protein VFR90_06865 [Methylibium sp.]|uniref:hypothetical protein n=1 Tax=Methylibium sp. TaxID=2067992 RepID=UPI002DB62685|nr:hypothetical protein [Methylibium sp.]HEU4458827.1 hypothetical protein [Methylibium sp.]
MAFDVERLGPSGAPEHARLDRKRGAFVHVVPRSRPAESPAAWVGQRVAYCFLKRSLVSSPRHEHHEAAALAAALADAQKHCSNASNDGVPDTRTLMAWANLKKRVQHSIARSVEPAFAASSGRDLGLPSCGSRFLDALMSSPLDYSHLPTIAGSWSRHVAALDIAARLSEREGSRLPTAQRLLTLTAHVWSPSSSRPTATSQFGAKVGRDVSMQFVPEAPWTVLQYLLAVAARSEQLDTPLLHAFALDLAAARWATSVLLDEGIRSWPGRWHVNEASDTARNLLLVGSGGGLRQAVTLAQRGYPWPTFKAPENLKSNFAKVRRAYRRTLTQFGVRTISLEEAVLPADLVRMRVQMSNWAATVGTSARSH